MFKGTVKEKWADLKKSSRFTGLVAALMGATFLLMILGNPRVEALHVPDVLKLVVSGMFLGFGFAGLMGMLNFPNSRKDQSSPPRNESGAGRGSVITFRPHREFRISTVWIRSSGANRLRPSHNG